MIKKHLFHSFAALLLSCITNISVWAQDTPTRKLITPTTTVNSYNASTNTYSVTAKADRYNYIDTQDGNTVKALDTPVNVVVHYKFHNGTEQTFYNDKTIDFSPGTFEFWATCDGFLDSDHFSGDRERPYDWTVLVTDDFAGDALSDQGTVELLSTSFTAAGKTFYKCRYMTDGADGPAFMGLEKYTGADIYSGDGAKPWLRQNENRGLRHQNGNTEKASIGMYGLSVGNFIAVTASDPSLIEMHCEPAGCLVERPRMNYGEIIYYEVINTGTAYLTFPETDDDGKVFYIRNIEALANNAKTRIDDLIALCKQEIEWSVGFTGTYDSPTSTPLSGEADLRTAIQAAAAIAAPHKEDYTTLDEARYAFLNQNEPQDGKYYTVSTILADPEVTEDGQSAWVNARTITDVQNSSGGLYNGAPDGVAHEIRGETNEYTPVRNRMVIGTDFKEAKTFSTAKHTVKTGLYSFDVATRGDVETKFLAIFYAYIKSKQDVAEGATEYTQAKHKYTAQQAVTGFMRSNRDGTYKKLSDSGLSDDLDLGYGWGRLTVKPFLVLDDDNVQIGMHAREYENCHTEDWMQADNYTLKYHGKPTDNTNWQKARKALKELLDIQTNRLLDSLNLHPVQTVDNFEQQFKYSGIKHHDSEELLNNGWEDVTLPKCIRDLIEGNCDTFSKYNTTDQDCGAFMYGLDKQEDEGIYLWMNAIGAKQRYAEEYRKLKAYRTQYYDDFSQLPFVQTYDGYLEEWKTFNTDLENRTPALTNLEKTNEWIEFFTTNLSKLQTATTTVQAYLDRLTSLERLWTNAQTAVQTYAGYLTGQEIKEYETLKDLITSTSNDGTINGTFDAISYLNEYGMEATISFSTELRTAYDAFNSLAEPLITFNTLHNQIKPIVDTDALVAEGDPNPNVWGLDRENLRYYYYYYYYYAEEGVHRPTSLEEYDAANKVLANALANFNASIALYNALAKEINYCNSNISSTGITDQTVEDAGMTFNAIITSDNKTTTTDDIEGYTQLLRKEEALYCLENYPTGLHAGNTHIESFKHYFQKMFDQTLVDDPSVDVHWKDPEKDSEGSPQTNFVTPTYGEHWDDTDATPYLEKTGITATTSDPVTLAYIDIKDVPKWRADGKAVQGDSDPAAVNLPTLPEGAYAFATTVRGSENAIGYYVITITKEDNTTEVKTVTLDINQGNTGLGVDVSGSTGYNNATTNFANDDEGYGWQWRIATFTVPVDATAVKIELKAASTDGEPASIGFCEADLASQTTNTQTELTRLMLWMQQYELYWEARNILEQRIGPDYYKNKTLYGNDAGIDTEFDETVQCSGATAGPPYTLLQLGCHFQQEDYNAFKELQYGLYLCDGTKQSVLPTTGWEAEDRNCINFSEQEQFIDFMMTTYDMTRIEANASICSMTQSAIDLFKKYSGHYDEYFYIAHTDEHTYAVENSSNGLLMNVANDKHGITQETPSTIRISIALMVDYYTTYVTYQGNNGLYLTVDDKYNVTTTADPNEAALFTIAPYNDGDLKDAFYSSQLAYKRRSLCTEPALVPGVTPTPVTNPENKETTDRFLTAQGNFDGALVYVTTDALPNKDTFIANDKKALNIWEITNYVTKQIGNITYMAGYFPNDEAYNDEVEARLKVTPYAEFDIQNVDNDITTRKDITLDDYGNVRNIVVYAREGQVGQQHNVVEVSTDEDGNKSYNCWCLEITDTPHNCKDYLMQFSHEFFCPEIIYERSVFTDQNWITLMLPYTVISYDSLQYYQFFKYDEIPGTHTKGETVGTLFFEKVEMLPARRPGAGRRITLSDGLSAANYFDIGEYNASVVTSLDDVERSYGDWSIVGCMKGQVVTETSGEDHYAFWNDSTGTTRDKFLKSKEIHVPPYRCYFKHKTSSSGGSAPDLLNIEEWDMPNGINDNDNGNDYYDDRRVQQNDNVVFFGKGEIIVEAGRDCVINIYTPGGILAASKRAAQGETVTFTLPSGTYIIDGIKVEI